MLHLDTVQVLAKVLLRIHKIRIRSQYKLYFYLEQYAKWIYAKVYVVFIQSEVPPYMAMCDAINHTTRHVTCHVTCHITTWIYDMSHDFKGNLSHNYGVIYVQI